VQGSKNADLGGKGAGLVLPNTPCKIRIRIEKNDQQGKKYFKFHLFMETKGGLFKGVTYGEHGIKGKKAGKGGWSLLSWGSSIAILSMPGNVRITS